MQQGIETCIMQVLVNGGVYYLVDGNRPFDFLDMQPIKAVIAHAPSQDAYRSFMKYRDGVHIFPWYMPPLEREEILEMLPIFPHVPEEVVGLARTPRSFQWCSVVT